MGNFFDENGLLHVEPDKPSENGILFAAELYTLSLVNGQAPSVHRAYDAVAATLMDPRKDWFPANPPQIATRFSHDNMTGLYCLVHNMGGDTTKLPMMRWNGRWWLHPRDILFYTAIRQENTILASICLLLLIPFLIHSCLRPRGETSGKCLWLLRLCTANISPSPWLHVPSKWLIILANTLLHREHGEKHWQDILNIYFKHPEHPLREQGRILYE